MNNVFEKVDFNKPIWVKQPEGCVEAYFEGVDQSSDNLVYIKRSDGKDLAYDNGGGEFHYSNCGYSILKHNYDKMRTENSVFEYVQIYNWEQIPAGLKPSQPLSTLPELEPFEGLGVF